MVMVMVSDLSVVFFIFTEVSFSGSAGIALAVTNTASAGLARAVQISGSARLTKAVPSLGSSWLA